MTEEGERHHRDVFAALLQDGITALHLDARHPGVRVPPWLRDRGWLVLNYSYRYNIVDFDFDDDEVFASLSFGGRPYPCRVPWSAVFGISDAGRDRLWIWPALVPADQVGDLLPAPLRAALPEDALLEQRDGSLIVHRAARLDRAPQADKGSRPSFQVIAGDGPRREESDMAADEPAEAPDGGDDSAGETVDAPPPSHAPSPRRPSHLRVVK